MWGWAVAEWGNRGTTAIHIIFIEQVPCADGDRFAHRPDVLEGPMEQPARGRFERRAATLLPEIPAAADEAALQKEAALFQVRGSRLSPGSRAKPHYGTWTSMNPVLTVALHK